MTRVFVVLCFFLFSCGQAYCNSKECEKSLITVAATPFYQKLKEKLLGTEAEVKDYLNHFKGFTKINLPPHEMKVIMGFLSKTHPSFALNFLDSFNWDNDSLLEFLKPLYAANTKDIYTLSLKLNLDEPTRAQIVLELMNVLDISDRLESFQFSSEDVRTDLAIKSIEKGYFTFYRVQENIYNIKSQQNIFRLLMALSIAPTRELRYKVVSDPNDSEYVRYNGIHKTFPTNETVQGYLKILSEEQRFQIALNAAKNFSIQLPFHISDEDQMSYLKESFEYYGLNKHQYKVEYIKRFLITLLVKQRMRFNLKLKNFLSNDRSFILSHKDKVETAKYVLENMPDNIFHFHEMRDDFLLNLFGNQTALLISNRISQEIMSILFKRSPLDTIAHFSSLANLNGIHLIEEENSGKIGLMEVFRQFSDANPRLLPTSFVESLWDRVKNNQVVLNLATEYFLNQKRQKIPDEKFPEDSVDILCKITGLPSCNLKSKLTEHNSALLYELLLDIQRGLDHPAFSQIKIEDSALENRSRLITFLTTLRNLKTLENSLWKTIESSLIGQSIHSQNILEVTDKIQKMVVTKIQDLLNSKNFNFTYEQLQKLQEQWGNLEPIFTLISRFNSMWKAEIPVLLEVFKASLENRFKEYKFSENHIAHQLPFNPSVIKNWMKERSLLSFYQESPFDQYQSDKNAEEAMKRAQDLLNTNILPHLIQDKGLEWVKSMEEFSPNQITWAEINLADYLKNQILNGDPRIKTAELLKLLPKQEKPIEANEALNLFKLVFYTIQKNKPSSDLYTGASKVLRSLLFSNAKDLDFATQEEQLKMDFKSLEKIFAASKPNDHGREGFILTVLNSDPKLLLTIGDVVLASSCQNYRTGGMIQTLLGYVIDSNVQALVSFALNPSNFKNSQDFNILRDAYLNKKPFKTEFDGNKRIATFKFDDENISSIKTDPLGYAYLRQMVKLGVTLKSKEPSLRLEREYSSSHPEIQLMREQHKQILEDLTKAINAKNDETMTMKKSINPGGHYSDLAGGVQMQDYNLDPPK